MDPIAAGAQIAIFFIPFLFSLCFHEFAHGWMAKRKGDNTAEVMGRLTMNPLPHIDWIGTVGLPIVAIMTGMPIFGWAKPVPVNPRNLSKPKEDMFWIALAGPLSNILLFFVGVLAAFVLVRMPQFSGAREIFEMLHTFLFINLLLAVFNMIPIHPLDGGKVLERFLPRDMSIWLEDNQHILNIGLIVFIVVGFRYVAEPLRHIINFFLGLAVGGAA